MSTRVSGACGDVRSSALWGTGNRGGDHRSNAQWGKRGRGAVAAAITALALAAPFGAGAAPPSGSYVAPGVLQAAEKNPNGKIRVIIQSAAGKSRARDAARGSGGEVYASFDSVSGVAADLPARAVQALSKASGLTITLDAPVKVSGYTSTQLWPHQNGVAKLWGTDLAPAPSAPAIAIVDSGIDTSLADFAGSVVHREVFTSLPQDALKLDGRGHGTFVAGIAAGRGAGLAGAAPNANLIDLDVMDDNGMARTSDVIRACDWILANKDAYNIRVANLSLHSSAVLSIRYHPLNKAVQSLWFSDVTVVAASGNYGTANVASGVKHAPGNDPFVITVGALDIGGTVRLGDDDVAPWSAYGYTLEGFAKPEIVAAGRYLVGPIPPASTLAAERPDRVVAPARMQLSGTSFAAPVVAGVAAQLLARNPSLTPEQIKGALMKTARRVPKAPRLAQGLGEINAVKAVNLNNIPLGNGSLLRFVVSDPDGSGEVFDTSAWYDAMKTDSAWDSSGWSDSAWTDSAWTDSAWADSGTYEDNAEGEGRGQAQLLTPREAAAAASDPDLALP